MGFLYPTVSFILSPQPFTFYLLFAVGSNTPPLEAGRFIFNFSLFSPPPPGGGAGGGRRGSAGGVRARDRRGITPPGATRHAALLARIARPRALRGGAPQVGAIQRITPASPCLAHSLDPFAHPRPPLACIRANLRFRKAGYSFKSELPASACPP
jgi:hypothetical protein